MMLPTRDDIMQALTAVADPATGAGALEEARISAITVRPDGRVGFLITLMPDEREGKAWLEKACGDAVRKLPGVTGVTALLTAQTAHEKTVPPKPAARVAAAWNTTPLAHVRRMVAVASGKGGVGKSTTAVNLAHALRGLGERVGVLDADIYGPSIPRMLGLSGMPDAAGGMIVPPRAHGMPAMSMGLLVGGDSALVWRGPQMSKALHQLLRGVAWGTADAPLDTLIIDMPPGTGDVHLSLVQQAPVTGAVIVTTPQEVAVADARKCIDMFRKVGVPVLGIIENMSGFTDPATGTVHAIFGEGGGRRLAQSQKVPFLGDVPIVMALREASDAGTVFEDKTGIYARIAAQLKA